MTTSKEPKAVFVTQARAEMYWIEKSRKYPSAFFKYLTEFEPASHHMDWWEALFSTKRVNIIAPRESAKAQPVDAPVLTPDGWTAIGSLRIGDLVAAQDGSFTPVTGVFPQGEKDIYRVTFTDGSSVECTDDHLWNVRLIGAKDGNHYRTLDLHTIRTKRWSNSTKDYVISDLEKPWVDHRGYPRYHIPITEPVQHPNRDFLIDPYVLGVLIGDGGLTNGTPLVSSEDPEIISELANLLPDGYVINHKERCTYAITYPSHPYRLPGGAYPKTPMRLELERLGLWGKRSEDKHIPNEYLFGSVEQRIALLQGLMNTDGSASTSKAGSNPVFSTSSPQLASDFRNLVWSLGGSATLNVQKAGYKDENGVYIECLPSYKIHVKFSNPAIKPFRLERKQSRCTPATKYPPTRGITDIEFVRRSESLCIKVAHPSELYLTQDYIVTHNTTQLVYTMAWLIGKNPMSTNFIGSVTASQSQDRLQMIREIIEYNPRFKNVFPGVEIDYHRTNNKSEFTVWCSQWNGRTVDYGTYRGVVARLGDLKNPTLFAAGAGSSAIIGRRFSGMVLVDDPHSEANSATEDLRNKLEDWFNRTLLPCVKEEGRVAVISTRWAETDLSGRLKEKPHIWKTVEHCAIDADGNSYWPEYWPVEKLESKREEVGSVMFDLMYMNNPYGLSSGQFTIDNLRQPLPDPLPEIKSLVVSVDFALTEKAASDYSVFTAVARDTDKRYGVYVLDMLRGKFDFDTALNELAKFCDLIFEKYGRLDRVLFEHQALTVPAEQEIRQRRPDLPVAMVPLRGDKGTRLNGGLAVKAQANNLYINLDMKDYRALVSELISFPKGAHDDIADSLSLPIQHWGSSDVKSGIIHINSPFML